MAPQVCLASPRSENAVWVAKDQPMRFPTSQFIEINGPQVTMILQFQFICS